MEVTEVKVDINNAIRAFYKIIDLRVVPILEFCGKAGYCAYACHFYLSNPRDDLVPGKKGLKLEKFYKSQYSILHKYIGKMMGRKELTEDDLKYWVELAYKYCSFCDNCAMMCPYSLVSPPLTFLMRGMIYGAGLTPPSLMTMLENEMQKGHPMGVTKEKWLNFIDEYSSKLDIKIPVDVEKADILFLPGHRSLVDNPESIAAAFKIFDHLKVNWTVSSELYTASLFPYNIGAIDELTALVNKRVNIIENLGVKSIVIGNDGQGFYTWRWESGRYLGRRPNFDIYHMTEFMANMLKKGKLKLRKLSDISIYTYQDPCNIARKGGVVKEPRKIIHELVTIFTEMPQHGVNSYCCSSGCFELKEYWDTRMDAFKIKLEQIEKTNAEKIITTCDMCNKTIKEGLRKYKRKGDVVDLTVLVSNSLET